MNRVNYGTGTLMQPALMLLQILSFSAARPVVRVLGPGLIPTWRDYSHWSAPTGYFGPIQLKAYQHGPHINTYTLAIIQERHGEGRRVWATSSREYSVRRCCFWQAEFLFGGGLKLGEREEVLKFAMCSCAPDQSMIRFLIL